MPISAPFPYYGGKRRVAGLIWDKFGNPTRYLEPFAGSLAVLLHRDTPCETEVVSDTDGYICNAWRSLQHDPEATAYHADYPTIHHDLTARQHTLIKWHFENSNRLSTDPDYFDPQIAGWWIWGTSNWIGANYAAIRPDGLISRAMPHVRIDNSGRGVSAKRKEYPVSEKRPHIKVNGGQGIQSNRKEFPVSDKRPSIERTTGGQGVSSQRKAYPVSDSRPHINGRPSGKGVQSNRKTYPVTDKIPMVKNHTGGHGVSQLRKNYPVTDGRPSIQPRGGGNGISAQNRSFATNEAIYDYFRLLSNRLRRVTTLNRPFEGFISPSLLGNTTTQITDTAIFLDPPYRVSTGRHSYLYSSDIAGTSEDVAVTAYEWAVENGDKFKIAYCCHEGDFEIPKNWTSITDEFNGVRKQSRRVTQRDMTMFSPKCDRDRGFNFE